MKTYILQTTTTITVMETVTAESEEAAIATGGNTGTDVRKQVTVEKTVRKTESVPDVEG